jgi:hypothetical protein
MENKSIGVCKKKVIHRRNLDILIKKYKEMIHGLQTRLF